MPTDIPWVSVSGAVFFAALIQSTTGIGFGVVAMPFLLIALSSSSAVQITIILSLGMSFMLCARSYRDCDLRLLRALMCGGALGLPIGLVAARVADPVALGLLTGAVLLFFATSIARRPVPITTAQPRGPLSLLLGASILSGAMVVCLAMPGPAVIGPLRRRCGSDQAVRATLFAYFVAAYTAAFGLQWAFANITAQTVWTSMILVPAMAIGVAAGQALAPRLSPRQIKSAIVVILIATSMTLIVTTARRVL